MMSTINAPKTFLQISSAECEIAYPVVKSEYTQSASMILQLKNDLLSFIAGINEGTSQDIKELKHQFEEANFKKLITEAIKRKSLFE